MAARVFVGPLSDSLEHVSMNFDAFIAKRRMMQGAKNIVSDFVSGYINVLPGEKDATSAVSNVKSWRR